MEFDRFLKEAVKLIGLQWRPFQRRGIKRKVERRIAQIGLPCLEEYLNRVKSDPVELNHLSRILTVTISRFFRDREVFNLLGDSLIPAMIKMKGDERDFKIWSIGCASGEEPYSLFLLWNEKEEKDWSKTRVSILASDIDERLLERAKEGRYKKSSVYEVTEQTLSRFFAFDNGFYILDRSVREGVEFIRHDIIQEDPFMDMDMVFCRNLAFTYFSKKCQVEVLKKIAFSLNEGGHLVIGKDEFLPFTYPTLFVSVFSREKIYQKFVLAK